jgi:hypothetical protein
MHDNKVLTRIFELRYRMQKVTYRGDSLINKKIKLSRYTPWRHMGGEEV